MENIKSIVIIGAGNVGSQLARILHASGYTISQIAGRRETNVVTLAREVKADYTLDFGKIMTGRDLYIMALPDSAIEKILPQLPLSNELLVHTSGSIPMDVLSPYSENVGVFYPLQTFSSQSRIDLKEVPILLEANRIDNENRLLELGHQLSNNVLVADSAQRQHLHVAAVFASNFSNHMYELARQILDEYELDFDLLIPLIRETAAKATSIGPENAQTGPALRKDLKVIEKHLELLKDNERTLDLYRKISESIIEKTNKADDKL